MLRVPVGQAKPGMILAQSIHHPVRPEIVLLRQNAELDRHAIPRLSELGVHEVWIRYPGLETLMKFVNPEMISTYRAIIGKLGLTLDAAMVNAEAELDYPAFRQSMLNFLRQVASDHASSGLVGELVRGSRPFVRHAGNTALVSVLMGLRLEHYLVSERARVSSAQARDVASMGIGAMFHDIGLLRLDPSRLAAWSATRDERDPYWQRHVSIGYAMVRPHLDASAAAVVLHHHQRFDGSGFPPREHISGTSIPLSGSSIHVFGRIVAVAEVFDRLRFPAFLPGEAELPSVPAVRVLAMMQRPPYPQILDPVALATLHEVVAPFSPGSIVTLSDGHTAAVTDWSADDPCRPTVLPLGEISNTSRRDESGVEPINLMHEPTLCIAQAEGQDVTMDLYPSPRAKARIPTVA